MIVRRFLSVAAFFATISAAIGLCASTAAATNAPPSIGMVWAVWNPKILPSGRTVMMLGKVLKRTKLNTVVVGTDLTFKVALHNGSISNERNTAVKLLIAPQRSNMTTEKTVTLASIRPGHTTTVNFDHLGAVAFGRKTNLTISVDGRDKTYPIIFSLPG